MWSRWCALWTHQLLRSKRKAIGMQCVVSLRHILVISNLYSIYLQCYHYLWGPKQRQRYRCSLLWSGHLPAWCAHPWYLLWPPIDQRPLWRQCVKEGNQGRWPVLHQDWARWGSFAITIILCQTISHYHVKISLINTSIHVFFFFNQSQSVRYLLVFLLTRRCYWPTVTPSRNWPSVVKPWLTRGTLSLPSNTRLSRFMQCSFILKWTSLTMELTWWETSCTMWAIARWNLNVESVMWLGWCDL